VILGTARACQWLERSLMRRGVPVLGLTSRWAADPGAPASPEHQWLRLLGRIAEAAGRETVLISAHDVFTALLIRDAELLRPRFLFDLPAAADFEVLRDKARFAELAARNGWPIPATASAGTLEQALAAAERLGFPVILKPVGRRLAFRPMADAKAMICATPLELERAYAALSAWEREMVVQAWIPGGDGEVYFSLHYHTEELRELGRFTGRKIRQWPPLSGSTSFAEPVHLPTLAEETARLLVATRCVGFGSVEYKRDPRDGRYYIIEPTAGRPDLQEELATANGVDFAVRAYVHLTGVPLAEDPSPRRPRRWIQPGTDLRAARHYIGRGELSWTGYLGSLLGPNVSAGWRPTDVRSYGATVANLLGLG
jgi:D-aspartate ligase